MSTRSGPPRREPPRAASSRVVLLALVTSVAGWGALGCAPPKRATPYPAAPAPEGEAPEAPSLQPGLVRVHDGSTLDVAPVVRGWFANGVHFARGRSPRDAALVWVDDAGVLWILDGSDLTTSSNGPSSLLERARRVEGVDLTARRLRRVERDVETGTLWLLLADATGDTWVEVDSRGRSTTLVDASAGIADIRRLADGVSHVWTAGPATNGPARLLARGATPDDARVLATLEAGERFASQPLVLDPDERVLWAAVIDAEGHPRILQVTRSPTAGGEARDVTNVPLGPPAKSRPRGATRGEPAASAEIEDVVLAGDTVDGALVFATWDGSRSTIATWSPGRARFVTVLERTGRIRQIDVLPGGVLLVVVERPGEHVRERVELAGRRVSEASSLPASLVLLGSIAEDSVWAYSSPQTPLTVVRTSWARDGGSAAEGQRTATNVPLLAPDEATRAAKARCKATWQPAEGASPGIDAGSWRFEPVGDVVTRHVATRSSGSTGTLPWSVDLALACAAGFRVEVRVEVEVESASARAADDGASSTVRWRRHDDSGTAMPIEVPFPKTPTRDDLAQAVAFVEFLVGGVESASAATEDGAKTDGSTSRDHATEAPDAP